MRSVPPVHSPLDASALRSGTRALLAEGGARHDLRRRIRDRWSPRGSALTDSGTSALRLALAAAAGGESACAALPAYGCYDLVTAAVGADLRVRLYDVDPRTLGPDPDSLRTALQAGAGIVVVAPLFGVPVAMDRVEELARSADALVIEDAAQSAFGAYRGRPLGARGSLAVLSFGRGKGLSGGGGGALLASDGRGEALLERAIRGLPPGRRGAPELATAAAQWLFGRPSLYGLPRRVPLLGLGETRYRAPAPPRGMSASSAAIVSAAWPLAEAELERRRRNADRLRSFIASRSAGLHAVEPPDGSEPGWLRLPLRLEAVGAPPAGPAARLGVARGYPRTLAELPALAGRSIDAGRALPGATALVRTLVTLPTHGQLCESDLRNLEAWIAAAPGAHGRTGRSSTSSPVWRVGRDMP